VLLLATEGFGGLSPNRRSIFNDRIVFGGYERPFHRFWIYIQDGRSRVRLSAYPRHNT